MENNFNNTENQLDTNDLNKFKNDYKLNLPSSYTSHILSFNGGYPDKDEIKGHVVSKFYPIKYGDYTLEEILNDLVVNENILPSDFFPFACDQGGNDFCISLQDSQYGKIYLFYHDTGGDVELIANSFKEFMENLVES